MGRQKVLYLSDEAWELLKDCNASELVSKLVRAHFEGYKKVDPEELREETIREAQEKLEEIENKISEKDVSKEQDLINQELSMLKLQKRIEEVKKQFREFEKLELTDEETREYLELFEAGLTNIKKFAEYIKNGK